MPVYNTEKYLRASIESILNQTFRNFELIIVDDGSTDNSFSIIKEYSLKDSRIVALQNEQNSGLSFTRNKCLNHSRGRYIAIQDADDISLPERLQKQVSFLEKEQHIGYCGSWMQVIIDDKLGDIYKYPNTFLKERMLSNCMFGHSSVMFRKSIIIDNNLSFNKINDPADDYGLQSRLIPFTNFYNLQEALVNYRIHNTNATANNTIVFEKAKQIRETIFCKLFNISELKPTISDNVFNFFVKYQYLDLPSKNDLKRMKTFMQEVFKTNMANTPFSEEGIKAVMYHYFFRILSRKGVKSPANYFNNLSMSSFSQLLKTYSIKDCLWLMAKGIS
jgi:glycosyltransferase involved in cell wall biosynthesis